MNKVEREVEGLRIRCVSPGTWEEVNGLVRFEDGRRGWTWRYIDGGFPDTKIYQTLACAVAAAHQAIEM